jgi:CRP/FNR family transcriptional regulator
MKTSDVMEIMPAPEGTSSVFSEESLALLQECSLTTRLSAGDYLYRENDPATRLYLVTEGSLKVCKPLEDGTSVTLSLHIPGDLFGEPDPQGVSLHRFEAQALEDSVIQVIPQDEVNRLIQTYSFFAIEFLNWMGLTQRMTQSKFRDLLLYGKSGALCSLLLRLSNMYVGSSNGRPAISKRVTNSQMAEMIGATRESVNRMLSEMRTLGVISTEGGRIILNNPDYLKGICKCEDCPKDICRM